MSLGAWARWLEADGSKRVWLLGVQPESLRAGRGLSAPVAAAVSALAQILVDAGSPGQSGLSDSKAATMPLRPSPDEERPSEEPLGSEGHRGDGQAARERAMVGSSGMENMPW